MIGEFLTRMRFFLSRRRQDDLDQELQFHIERETEAKIAAGLAPDEAHRQALIAFGGVERAREGSAVQHPAWLLNTVLQDVRYALRGFRRNPVFTLTVIATLALGIGATTAVFSVVDPILFRSLPYAHADRLVSVGLTAPIMPQEFMLGGSYYEWRDHQIPFEALTSETGVNACDLTEPNPARLSCASVESSFLPTLGIVPFLGRNFTASEDRPNAPKVALISYGLWQRHYGHNSGILNKTIEIDGKKTRVIGILPKTFEMPTLEATDIVLPQALDEAEQRKADPGRPMYAFARLKPGVSIEQAKAELQPVFDYSLRLAPPRFRKEVHLQVRSLRDRQVHDLRLAAWVLLGTVIATLLIVCANVASLLLARAARRERELAVRLALGAGQVRLARQAMTEALILTSIGTLAGIALAEVFLLVFIAVAPEAFLFLAKARLDGRILLFTVVVAVVCGLVFGLIPALQKPRAEALAGRASGASSGRLRKWLVTVQIAVSTVLLASGMLLLRSFLNLENQPLGMQTESILTASISLGQQQYGTPVEQMAFFQQAQTRLRQLPGVSEVALSDSLPPGSDHHDQVYTSIAIAGRRPPTGGTGGMVAWRWVTPDYFRVLSIPILQGSGFSKENLNSTERFVVLSQLLASRLFPGENPIGEHLQVAFPASDDPMYTVVGIAANVKNGGLTGENQPEYYRLRRNRAEDWDRSAVILIKTSGRPDVMAKWLRSQIASLDPTVPVEIETLNRTVHRLADRPRFETALLGFFAFAGLLLAVIGLYGVVAFLVAQRTQEIGVRMALGASRLNILRLVLWEGLRLIAAGGMIGLAAALTLSRMLKSLLFSIGPHDPVSFIGVALLLAMVALIATLIPARAAMKVDPMVALRCE